MRKSSTHTLYAHLIGSQYQGIASSPFENVLTCSGRLARSYSRRLPIVLKCHFRACLALFQNRTCRTWLGGALSLCQPSRPVIIAASILPTLILLTCGNNCVKRFNNRFLSLSFYAAWMLPRSASFSGCVVSEKEKLRCPKFTPFSTVMKSAFSSCSGSWRCMLWLSIL